MVPKLIGNANDAVWRTKESLPLLLTLMPLRTEQVGYLQDEGGSFPSTTIHQHLLRRCSNYKGCAGVLRVYTRREREG
jgi:hypothetical protein